MDAMETDRLIDDYLHRLEQAAAHMQRARRGELVAEIREHIDTALRQEQPAGEAAVRNVLDRLGPPEEIVEAAEPSPPPVAQRAGILDVAALFALLVPVLGWLIGIVLVFASRVWSRRNKLIGALLLFLPIVLLGLGFTATSRSGSDEAVPPGDTRPVGEKVENPSSGAGPADLVLVVVGLPSALYLGWQLRRELGTSPTQS